MERRDADIEWIITEKVTGEVSPDGKCTVYRADGQTCVIGFDLTGQMLFDGRYVDVAEDFLEFLSVLDDIERIGESEPYDDTIEGYEPAGDGQYKRPDES